MRKILIGLLMVATVAFSAVGLAACNEKNPEPPKHEHYYVDGVCVCGDEIENYYTEGLVFTKNAELDGYTVTGYTGDSGSVIIPEIYDALPVTTIGADVFINKPQVTKIVLPNSLKIIEDYAFWGSAIKSITLPESLESIGIGAFKDCVKLETIYYNAVNCSAISLGLGDDAKDFNAFSGVGSTLDLGTTLYIGKSVKVIPAYAFSAGYDGAYATNAKLTHVIFEDGSQCERIGQQAFRDLRYLKTFTFGNTTALKEIGKESLAQMGRFTDFSELVIPASVEKIGVRALTMGKHSQDAKPAKIIFNDIEGWYSTQKIADYDAMQDGTMVDVSKLIDGDKNVFALVPSGHYMYKSK